MERGREIRCTYSWYSSGVDVGKSRTPCTTGRDARGRTLRVFSDEEEKNGGKEKQGEGGKCSLGVRAQESRIIAARN